jgi:hypothetical protein
MRRVSLISIAVLVVACGDPSDGSGRSGLGGDSGSGGMAATGGTAGMANAGGAGGLGEAGTGGTEVDPCGVTTQAGCILNTSIYGDEVSLPDSDSLRASIATWCVDEERYIVAEECGYDQICDQNSVACTGCGDAARNASHLTVDGILTEDCRGCRCNTWTLSHCTGPAVDPPDGTITVTWFAHRANLPGHYGNHYLTVTPDGTLLYPPDPAVYCGPNRVCETPPRVDVINADLRPGGEVELDIQMTTLHTDNFGVTRELVKRGHVTGTCN